MAQEKWMSRGTRALNRVHARLSALARPATGFVSQPEPRTIGSFARGRQLVAGNLLFAGQLHQDDGSGLWAIGAGAPPDPARDEETHGFAWLDDVAAVGDRPARLVAQKWLWDWIARYGRGGGAGWTPELTGRRLIRWIHHAIFLLNGQDTAQSQAFYRSLARQTIFLGRRWKGALPGLPRFEALTGLIYAGLSLEGMERLVDPAVKALARDCRTQISGEGGIPTRNPEELLEVCTLLTWAAAALREAGKTVPPEIMSAIERIAPSLRSLRHADGGLARFHGGGRGLEGRLDWALANSGVKTRHADGLAMGYARLSAGRTSVIIDAAPPPGGKASFDAHASTLAFELTSGRRPLIVNCGSGAHFGEDWRRAGRATPSHSALALEGYSSARLGRIGPRREMLVDAPREVPVQITHAEQGLRFEGGHDGYLKTHGLTHARTLDLSFDGRGLKGEDLLVAIEAPDQVRFDAAMDAAALQGIPYQVRFHLHPEVDASLDMGGAAVSLALKSGEVWVFRTDGSTKISLEPGVYLEKNRLKPRAAQQIVLSGRALEYATRLRWTLSKTVETPVSIRDLKQDGPGAPYAPEYEVE